MKSSLPLQIRTSIKNLLKKNGFKYAQVAQHMEMSEASFKQLISKGTLSVERLEGIASFFGLSLWELMDLCRGVEVVHSSFELAQEKTLAKDPVALRLMILLSTGMSFKTVKGRLKSVEPRKLQKALFVLAKMDLIEILENDAVKIKKRGPFKFLREGPLSKAYKKVYVEKLLALLRSPSESDSFNHTFELFGTKEMADSMSLELNEFLIKYTNRSKLETKTKPETELHPISCAFLISCFDGWGEALSGL